MLEYWNFETGNLKLETGVNGGCGYTRTDGRGVTRPSNKLQASIFHYSNIPVKLNE